jgi:hypothetical protein
MQAHDSHAVQLFAFRIPLASPPQPECSEREPWNASPIREDNSARDAVTHKSVGKAETSQATVPIQKGMERQNVEHQVTGPGQGMTRSELGVTFLLLVSQVHLMVRTVWENVISSHNWLDISTASRIKGLKSRSHCYSHCIAHQQSVAI